MGGSWTVDVLKMAVLALLYLGTGELGLSLAVPPGYATIIWPPSGIAIGALIMHGARLWPGVFVGSLALNALVGGAVTPDLGVAADKLLIAASIAAGSTLQTLAARWLVARFLTLPIDLRGISNVVLLFLLVGPAACLIAATVGTGTLLAAGALPLSGAAWNWWTWWCGDVLGVIVFLPLTLIAPGSPHKLTFGGARIGALPIAALLVLLLPLGLTFYVWKATSESVFEKSAAAFDGLAGESEHALISRLFSYEQALRGGLGFFRGSETVTHDEWRTYVTAIGLRSNYPGMLGLGFIESVEQAGLPALTDRVRRDLPGFAIHPEGADRPHFIITYIEPERENASALGLDIGFEANRTRAAETARDTGQPAITQRILLVQDATKSPGFLLLSPMYRGDAPIGTVEERRAALRGWIYAPFIGRDFMDSLTVSQGAKLELAVFDGEIAAGSVGADEALIFDSLAGRPKRSGRPAFTVRKRLDVFQRPWTVVWTSTPAFEASVVSREPTLILVGGLIATGLLAIILFAFARRTEMVTQLVELRTREIRASEDMFRSAMHFAPIGKAMLDARGGCIAANPALCQMLGYDEAEMRATNLRAITHPDDLPASLQGFERLWSGAVPLIQLEKRYFHKDGHPVWANVYASLAYDAEQAPSAVILQVEDITRRKEAERLKSDFVSVVSHELRTPLTSIRGALGLVVGTMAGDLPPKAAQLVRIAHKNAERLVVLINDILDTDKLAAGEMAFDPQAERLAPLVAQAIEANQGYAQRFHVELALVEADDSVVVEVDPDRLAQVLANLLSNAAKYSPEGGRVEVRAGIRGDAAFVSVRDFGPGVPAEFRDRIFSRFSQADSSVTRQKGGTGLGLHISKQIMDRMGGEIGFESQPGMGSTFWITLPLVAVRAERGGERLAG